MEEKGNSVKAVEQAKRRPKIKTRSLDSYPYPWTTQSLQRVFYASTDGTKLVNSTLRIPLTAHNLAEPKSNVVLKKKHGRSSTS